MAQGSLDDSRFKYRPFPIHYLRRPSFPPESTNKGQNLHQSESMLSLCYRSLASYINDDNLSGLQTFLENKQVQVDDRDENGSTALMLAASKGKIGFVKELLTHGADPNADDVDQWSALLCAAKEGHADVCHELLEQAANIEHRDMGGWTALMWATYKGRTEVVNLLLERGADVNAHGNFHITSLLWASGRGHTQIAQALISHGAKVNVGDKYGTTALVWASRKGHTDIVDSLLRAGANVDTAGMYSWTALLVATQHNHVDVVNLLLEHKPNVNALDKDGCSALTIACKEGYYEIATALLSAGAYINVQDRAADTNLIHAVKGGHRGIVEALLKKYADVDICGKDRKTAIYMAVEKGNVAIVKLLLNANPELEIATKDGDTPLLKAVRSRNAEVVQLLLEKKAKVNAADRKGDTALHIAMRARSRTIVEILLRNPKNSQLLYRPNKSGETPYNIDMNNQKTILGQIFGARRLNTNEDTEGMLGYDLYSSALADILSEPSLSMPITVGLYAKWGSGKSFLLRKLRDEMKNFARVWVDPAFTFTSLLFLVILHIAEIIGVIVGLSSQEPYFGLLAFLVIFVAMYLFLILTWVANKRWDCDWPYNFNLTLTRRLTNLKLILQIIFCHPPGGDGSDLLSAQPIRYYFTDQTRVSSSGVGENSVVQMIGSLYDAIENHYGSVATRLYRAFKPKPVKSSSSWRWRKSCCIPHIVIFEVALVSLMVGACALTLFLIPRNTTESSAMQDLTMEVIIIGTALLLAIISVANVYTWNRVFVSLLFSQRRHLQRKISRLETLKSEGFLQILREEVTTMKQMVKCLDSLSGEQTRLVVIVDGLDSCEQDKVLLVLDAVHMLFSDLNSPFIVLLAIDPHVIAKAVETNSRKLFSESNIGGHSYLNNMVHLPFYLQNSGLRKVKVAQQTALTCRKLTSTTWNEADENNMPSGSLLGRSLSNRRLSAESTLMSSTEKLKFGSRKGSRKLKLSESVASSIGSNLNKIGGAQDLTKMLLTDDYFSDVNPRSMRRLMNVVYITGRLLKSFQIDFNWYRLASWINITEQWPFRTSWMIYHYDLHEDSLDDGTSLKTVYEKVRSQISTLKDTEPLLELDRDERKLEVFLAFHKSSLLVSDMKVFLPFTINLDPYLKKLIKEETQAFTDDGLMMHPSRGMNLSMPNASSPWTVAPEWSKNVLNNRRVKGFNRRTGAPSMVCPPTSMMNWTPPWADTVTQPFHLAPVTELSPDVLEHKLSTLSVDGVCKLLAKTDEITANALSQYQNVIKSNNINGKVLLHCDMEDLKAILKMNFGDWEMFKVLILSLREHEVTSIMQQNEKAPAPKVHAKSQTTRERKVSIPKLAVSLGEKEVLPNFQGDNPGLLKNKQSMIEKQVTLEEQMICGALQTLNEEACEDVLEETEEVKPEPEIPHTAVIPPSPDLVVQEPPPRLSRSRTNSTDETNFILLQSSPISYPHWQPVGLGNSESLSEHSSRTDSPPPSLDDENKKLQEFRLSRLKSVDTNEKKRNNNKHVHIQQNLQQQNTVADPKRGRPVSLHLFKEMRRHSLRNRSKSIDHSNANAANADDKLQLLKEKLLHSSPALNEGSDTEDTPLVSAVNSPTSVNDLPLSTGVQSSTSSEVLSSPLQERVVHSISNRLCKRRSSQNLDYCGGLSPQSPCCEEVGSDDASAQREEEEESPSWSSPEKGARVRTLSECADSYELEPRRDYFRTSSVSLNSAHLGHMARQNAIESMESIDDDENEMGFKPETKL